MNSLTLQEQLIEKVQQLSADEIKKVEDFINSLKQGINDQKLTNIYAKLSENSFNKIWDNPKDAEYDDL